MESFNNDQFQILANVLIQDFENQSLTAQQKIINTISKLVQQDEKIFISLEKQVKENYQDCLQLLIDRKFIDLNTKLQSISPMAAINLNLKLSQVYKSLIEEGPSLIQTFLPYLQKCNPFKLQQEQYIPSIFEDPNSINIGLTSFAIKFTPSSIQQIIRTDRDKKVLLKALTNIGFNKDHSKIMSEFPQKFLWQEVLEFLRNQNDSDYYNKDPGQNLKQLIDLLQLRKIFTSCLIEQESIKLTIQQLVQILTSLKGLSADSIKACLTQSSNSWLKISESYQAKDLRKEQELNEEQIENLMKEYLEGKQKLKIQPHQQFLHSSDQVQSACQQYEHNLYQCAISHKIASQNKDYIIVEMPTGSGKTRVQAILSKFYIDNGKKVTIIEPNDTLKLQTLDFLSNLDHDLSIVTIDEFYQFPTKDEILIINEYDTIVLSHGITGLWQLLNRKVLFFTATSNKGIEKIIKNIFLQFSIVRFKSEYEIVKQVSNLSQGIIKTFKSNEEKQFQILKDIQFYYIEKPIILFSDLDKINLYTSMLQQNNLTQYLVGASQENLKEIKSSKYGILLLDIDHAIGTNCKFAIDSIVLITSELKSESLYIQAQGRSSRSRGACNSVYYVISEQSGQSILKSLNSYQMQNLQDQERLLKVIWSKRYVKALEESLEEAQNQGDNIRTLKDLETLLGKYNFSQLIKGMKF